MNDEIEIAVGQGSNIANQLEEGERRYVLRVVPLCNCRLCRLAFSIASFDGNRMTAARFDGSGSYSALCPPSLLSCLLPELTGIEWLG